MSSNRLFRRLATTTASASTASLLRPAALGGDSRVALARMRDSTSSLGDPEALRAAYEEDGYLLLRGLLDRDNVSSARRAIIERLSGMGRIDENARSSRDDDSAPIAGDEKLGVGLYQDYELQKRPEVKTLLEASELFSFFESFFGEPCLTYSYKWLRAVAQEEFTGAHLDTVYMGRGSQDLMTAWIPLGDLSCEDGTLMVCPSSHTDEAYKMLRDEYGKLDVDRDVPGNPSASGHVTNCPTSWDAKAGFSQHWDHDALQAAVPPRLRSTWVSEDFQMGDVVVFGMRTLHMSTTNLKQDFRISCDTRWQPASHPVDERWSGSPEEGARHRFFIGDDPSR